MVRALWDDDIPAAMGSRGHRLSMEHGLDFGLMSDL